MRPHPFLALAAVISLSSSVPNFAAAQLRFTPSQVDKVWGVDLGKTKLDEIKPAAKEAAEDFGAKPKKTIKLIPSKNHGQDARGTIDASGGGGGNQVDHELFDFYENRGTVEIKLEEQPFFKEDVEPIIKKISVKIPEFRDFLLDAARLKVWMVESKPITDTDCLNPSMVETNQTIAACQDRNQVRLSKDFLASADSVNRAGLIIHELILTYGLELLNPENRLVRWYLGVSGTNPNIRDSFYVNNPKEVQSSVRRLVRSVFSDSSGPELRQNFEAAKMARFMPPSMAAAFQKIQKSWLKLACENDGDGFASKYAEYEWTAIHTYWDASAASGFYPIFDGAYAGKAAMNTITNFSTALEFSEDTKTHLLYKLQCGESSIFNFRIGLGLSDAYWATSTHFRHSPETRDKLAAQNKKIRPIACSEYLRKDFSVTLLPENEAALKAIFAPKE